MRRVRWRRLELGGFGPYRRVVRVEFSSGMNVLVAPNERGKSTLVAGLLGVLYGLPEEGLERFRNWEEPAAFYGELEFEVDGVSYLLRRDFGRDEHALARRENGGWVEVASGRRQERGGRAALIERLIGIGSPELFEATFCVRQPLPGAAQLDRLVERFVSGAGAGRYQAALEALESRLRQITRFTADRGVGRLNLPRDGRLEALNARIGELSERVVQSRAVVDSLQAARERLQAASAERAAAQEELGQRRAAQAAWAEWRQHWRAYRIATDQRRQAEGVLAAWEERSRAVAWMRDRLARAYAPFDELGLTPEAAEGEIDRLIDAAEAVWEARRAADERAGALAELKARRAALEDAGRCAVAALEADAAEIQRAIEKLRPWGEWSPHPTAELERIREQAAACQATWRELERLKARRDELDAALRDRYGPLAELTEEARQALLALDARRRALEEAITHAQSELKAVRRQRAAFERERDAFERAFGDLIELDDDAVGAVEALIRARQEEERLAGELEKIKQADREMRLALRRRRWAAAGTGGAVG
ncbi:MAG TPA: AAA family ATPase, partial [Limnochordia bacterium]